MRKEEQSLEDNIKLELSPAAKKEYLKKLSGRIVKILYLIEGETEETAGSAESYILGQIFELNASNVLFDNALVFEFCFDSPDVSSLSFICSSPAFSPTN